MENTSILAAFTGGLLSFLSPCILPLIPAYLSFISGVSLGEMRKKTPGSGVTLQVFINSLFFVLGFSFIFISLGASATFIGGIFITELDLLKKIAGILVIFFGIHTLGIFRIKFLDREKRYHQTSKPLGLFGSFLVGVAFAIGWTPCIGPILASILFYASTKETVMQGIGLLSVYSAGLGIPFLLTALGMERFINLSTFFKKHFRAIEIVSGLLLIAVGILILTDDMTRITQYIYQILGDPASHQP